MNRVLISCGGTGGHLTPGIALAEGLLARGHTCWLLISRKKVDARLVQKYPHLSFVKCPGAPFSLHPTRLLRFLIEQTRSLIWSARLIRRLRPDIVVGFGGFSSAGISVAAFACRLPFVLHESNRIPGRAIRFLSRFSPTRVYLPKEVHLPNISSDRIRFYGNPVRKEIQCRPKAAARAALGIEEEGKLLVVLGGSQGATALNDWAEENFEALAEKGISVYCVTGMRFGDERVLEFSSENGSSAKARFVPFTDQVSELFSGADLVLSRAGAGTIAELIRCRAPSILIPYPYSADDHQQANAAYLEEQGGSLVVDQDSLGGLLGEVFELMEDDSRGETMRNRLEEIDSEDSLRLILDDLEAIGRSHNRAERRLKTV